MALRLHRFKDRDTRRLFGVILGGKLLGVAGLLAGMKLFALPDDHTHAVAAGLGRTAYEGSTWPIS
jgi:hypothetical protein